MGLITTAIKRPVAVTVLVLLTLLFGFIGLKNMPIQMKPTIDKPFITINTDYPAAAPQEVEEQITVPMEEKLQAVENLRKITSVSSEGRSSITLEFDWGTDKDIATIDIIKKLNLVGNLPEEAKTPIIKAITSDEERPIYWGNLSGNMTVNQMRQIADDFIKPRLERGYGVGDVRIYGGQDREIQVELDYAAMAARSISVKDIRKALRKENQNVRGGAIEEGKRRYIVRTIGLFKSAEDMEKMIIRSDNHIPIYLRDVAKVLDRYKDESSLVKIDGKPAIGIGVIKKSGANTILATNGVEAVMKEVNRDLKPKGILMGESYDESDYIWDSIKFVVSNIVVGSIFAMAVLLLFLRSIRTTLIVGATIPVSIFASFIIMEATGRSLNTISLAGLAFAAGMIVDNAIVVLENIYRHMEQGKPSAKAALDGSVEVWGALLASTLTTLAVFLPIIFIEEEAGQMFKDIAIAVSCAVGFSLLAALTIIPAMSAKMLAGDADNKLKFGVLDSAASWVAAKYEQINRWQVAKGWRAFSIAATLLALFLLTTTITPPKEYMPQGNRNFIFLIMKPIVGMNNSKVQEMSDIFAERINSMSEKKMMFHVISNRFKGMGMRVTDEWKLRVGEVAEKVNGMLGDVPGFLFVRAFQVPLFQRSMGKGFDIEIKGRELSVVQRIGREMQAELKKIDGVRLVRSSFTGGNPEYRIRLDRERAAGLGVSVQDAAEVIETLVAGKKATTFKEGGKEYDVTLRGNRAEFVDYHSLENIMISANGTAVPLKSFATIEQTTGPTAIDHIEMDRSIKLKVTIGKNMPLETMMNLAEQNVINPMRAKLPAGYSFGLTGAAEDLKQTADALTSSFLLAVLIIYLLMSALFESFFYPLVIMLTVPLAAMGAIIAVVITGAELNVVTMLGFIILTGIVVNNGILLVHQALRYLRAGNNIEDAIQKAVHVRLRPIFMSSITTILGMLPLTFRGGAGSEIYSGLGAAIVGGLTTSTIFTLILIPGVFVLFGRLKQRLFGNETVVQLGAND